MTAADMEARGMAGDWIKIRVGLRRNPKVIAMTDYLAGEREFMNWVTDPVRQHCKESLYDHVTHVVTACVTVTGLVEVWGVANLHGKVDGDDLILRHAAIETLDEFCGMPCFGRAMELVGWAKSEEDDDGISSVRFPGFMLYNVPVEDRKRASAADRQRKKRARDKGCDKSVTESVTRHAKCHTPLILRDASRDASGAAPPDPPLSFTDTSEGAFPSEEKNGGLHPARRGVKKEKTSAEAAIHFPDLPAELRTDRFEGLWAAWVKHRAEIRKPLKPTQVVSQVAKLAAWGHDHACEVIAHTIAMGWQGLREPDLLAKGNGQPQRAGVDMDAYTAQRLKEEANDHR